MTFVGWHGDPCRGTGCVHREVKHRAEEYGYCRSCWLGATERQRRDAIFDEAMDAGQTMADANAAHAVAEIAWLEGIFALGDPEPEQYGEAA